MIYLVCILAGMIAGGAGVYVLRLRFERTASMPVELTGMRWERPNSCLNNQTLKHLRRHYPTHDLITSVPFLDMVHPKGARSEAVAGRCRAWSVGVVMIDKRTTECGRLILWADDAELENKTWILRRAGYKVIVVERDGEEQGLLQAMAA